MKQTTLALALLSCGAVGSVHAASFNNGGFESGSFSSWSQGSGCWSSNTASIGQSQSYSCAPTAPAGSVAPYTGAALPLNPGGFFSGGAYYNPAAVTGTQVLSTAGTDAITGQSLNHGAQYGNYLARVGNSVNNYSVSAIRQSVSSYDGTSINFAWWAVLEGSHGANDSDNFSLTVRDDTLGSNVYSTAFSSATTGALFTNVGGWYTSGWQDISLAVTQGHNFTITLLAADCPYGGHAGYVYLDGFGTTSGGGGDDGGGSVPEPGTLALAGLGLMVAAGLRRRKHV